MMKKEYVIYFLMLILCLAIGYQTYEIRQLKRIAMIDVIKLFNEFKMKKELESIEKIKLEKLSSNLDSIENILKVMQNDKKDISKELIEKYNMSKYTMEEEFKAGNQLINEQIWKRLNPMIDEFGKQKKMHLIFGANGMGTVLYNDDYMDITNEAIDFINKKYEQGN